MLTNKKKLFVGSSTVVYSLHASPQRPIRVNGADLVHEFKLF
jgi:hypothetical protein